MIEDKTIEKIADICVKMVMFIIYMIVNAGVVFFIAHLCGGNTHLFLMVMVVFVLTEINMASLEIEEKISKNGTKM